MFLLRGSVLLLVAKWVKSSSVKILLTQGWAVKADIRLHQPPLFASSSLTTPIVH